MTEATILTHVAALLAGIFATFGYLKHVAGWQSSLQSELNLLKHHLGLGPLAAPSHPAQVPSPSAPAASVSSPGAAGGVHTAAVSALLLFVLLMPTLALADRPAKIPTGYEVRGKTHYVLRHNRVVQIDPKSTRNAQRFWNMQDRLGSGGGAAGSDAGSGS